VAYLSVAPKSNAVYKAFNQVMADIRSQPSYDVPLHIRNAPTKLMKDLDYGKEYRYAHDEPDAFAAGENYLPEEIASNRYYFPSEQGLEKTIGEKLARFRAMNESSTSRRYGKGDKAEGSKS
jgi:putative ATPase